MFKNSQKNMLISEQNIKCRCYYFSKGIIKVRFFENLDQRALNNIDMVLIRNLRVKGGI